MLNLAPMAQHAMFCLVRGQMFCTFFNHEMENFARSFFSKCDSKQIQAHPNPTKISCVCPHTCLVKPKIMHACLLS
jgi:hypothetical protein